MLPVTDLQKIGVGLAGFGIAFLFLGVLLLFDKGLLAIGNILFICGLAFVIGLERTFRFFFQQHKMKATAAFMGGILVVLLGWPLIGMIIETYGFILLFGGFLPVAVNFLRRVPVIGTLLSLPGISSMIYLILIGSIVLLSLKIIHLVISIQFYIDSLEYPLLLCLFVDFWLVNKVGEPQGMV